MSDDFFDDIVLDEDALAILDAEESKYFGTVANIESNPRPVPTQPTPPPAKRQRTDGDGGWKYPTTGVGGRGGKVVSQNQKRSDSFYEDLPDISLAGDGVYGVYSQGSQLPQNSNFTHSGTKTVTNPLGQRSQSTGFQKTVPAPVPVPAPPPRERTSSSNQNRPPPRPPLQRTHTPPPNVPHNQTRGPVPPQPNRAQNLGPGRTFNVSRQQPLPQQTRHVIPPPVQSRPPNANATGGTTDTDFQDEVAKLRAQLEQVRAWQHYFSSGCLNVIACGGM